MNAVSILKRGGVGVLATDTIYGVVGQALNRKTVERIYRIKKRTPTKPFIILISSVADLAKFGVHGNALLKQYWPGKVSIILPCEGSKFRYLHRGTNALAFRFPRSARLMTLLKKTGPLVAPSANPEGLPPATTIMEAEAYFGERVDFYESSGKRAGKPSMLISINDGTVQVLRK